MDEQQNKMPRPVNPRRRKRSQMQIFKEAYLPVIIAGAAVLLIIIFIIGSISRSIQKRNDEREASIAASIAAEEALASLRAEAAALIAEAAPYAEIYDYQSAIAVLDRFSGNMSAFADITAKREEYVKAQESLVAWSDPSLVTSLSFQVLIADPSRAFSNATYGSSYNRNFVTTDEFRLILQQLYDNGYMLVSLDDFLTTETTDTGAVIYEAKTLYLPQGKKPLLLTQTQVNYYTYMVDSDGDGLADKNGAGFASKLVIADDGSITCEMVNKDGNTVTGEYDLVPILDAFVEAHPDFSYLGAKAILAVTGYNGVFGYRTYAEAKEHYGAAYYNAEVEGAKKIAEALRNDGYEIACYTYGNENYGDFSSAQIQADLSGWTAEVVPILGKTNILVYARESDITTGAVYSGDKYNTLQKAGFQYFLGFCTNGELWVNISDDYVRIGRILVSGKSMTYNSSWFSGIFDPSAVLDRSRGTVPN